MDEKQAELVLDAGAIVGEGPHWDGGRGLLLWVDIMGCRLHATAENGGSQTSTLPEPVGAAVPRTCGGMLLALQSGFATYDWREGKSVPICDPEAHLPQNRFNDGKCDARGRFWAGTMAMENARNEGSLYCLAPDLSCTRKRDKIGISNGLAWSHDNKTLYFIDTLSWSIRAFDFDLETGHLGRSRVVIRVPKRTGAPDGMAIDSDGMLWVAHWGGGRVCRWDPTRSSLLQTVSLPVSLTTSCAFGGDDLSTLFITSASNHLSPRQRMHEPHAGGLFAVRPGCTGIPANPFAG